MNETVKLNVFSIDEMGKRFIGTWHKLERGGRGSRDEPDFLRLESVGFHAFAKAPGASAPCSCSPSQVGIGSAKTLARDYKCVHAVVSVLEHAGFLVREDRLIKAPYDHVQVNVSLLTCPGAALPGCWISDIHPTWPVTVDGGKGAKMKFPHDLKH